MPGELVLGALRHAWQSLNAQKIKAAVMGGLAITHWGRARFTRDADLLIDASATRGDEIARFMGSAGFFPRRVPPVTTVADHSFIQFLFTPPGRFEDIAVDLLFADSPFLKSAIGRAEQFRLVDGDIPVVSCEDLILLKLQADRIIDRSDVVALLQYNRERIDLAYLAKWIEELSLQSEWTQWWPEAFPGEPSPIVFTAS